jgi:hypothetical protein
VGGVVLSQRAFQPRKQNSHRSDEWKRCDPYLAWLRKRPCFIALHDRQHICSGKVRACHYDPWGDKGTGTKVSDNASLPMCDGAHGRQHSLGWTDFEAKYNFDGRDIVTRYWLQWRDGTQMGAQWKLKQEGRA